MLIISNNYFEVASVLHTMKIMRYFQIAFTADFGNWDQRVEAYPWAGTDDPAPGAVASFVSRWLDPQAVDVNMIGFSEFIGPNAAINYNNYVTWYNARKTRLLTNHLADIVK